jgi:hypothetical protein
VRETALHAGYRQVVDPVGDLRNLIGRRVRFRQDGVAEDTGEITGVGADLYYDLDVQVRLTVELLDGSEWSVMTASDLGSVTDFVSDSGAFCLPLADAPVLIDWDDDQASPPSPGNRSRRSALAE